MAGGKGALSTRPAPPADLFQIDATHLHKFVSAPELGEWARANLIDSGSPLINEDHAHLRAATIGFLWTNMGNARQGRRIVGQCETGKPRGAMGKWPKARAEQQILEWFGEVPDFLITIDANYAQQCGDAEFCALIDHELYHAGQERDAFGAPKFTREGRPVFGMRGHDVEEFVGIVRRYGVGAAAGDTFALVEAARGKPTVAATSIASVCGNCRQRASVA